MGQVSLQGTLIAGPVSASDTTFPGGSFNVPFATTPSPKPVQVQSGDLRQVQSPLAYVTLSGIGATDTVTRGELLYLRTNVPMNIRITTKQTPGPDLVQVSKVNGLLIQEFPSAQYLVLLEAEGSGQIEYFVSGPQLQPHTFKENTMADSFKTVLDFANPSFLADMFRRAKIGTVLRALTTNLRRKVPGANALTQLATLQSIALPDDAKASAVTRAYAYSGTGTLGELAVQLFGVTPGATQVGVAPNGDITFLAADAYTLVDVQYTPEKQDVASFTLPVVAHVLTLPTAVTTPGCTNALEVTSTKGGVVSKMIILIPGSGAPAAGQCRLNFLKTTITFAVADAVTEATIKVGTLPAVDVDALLEATETAILGSLTATTPFG